MTAPLWVWAFCIFVGCSLGFFLGALYGQK